MHEVVNNMWRREIKDYGEKIKKAQKLRRENVKGRNKWCREFSGATKILREKTKSEGEKG